jgi:hypothetical protein
MSHFPGHYREMFLAAVEAFASWRDGPEPTVEFEVGYEPKRITLSEACNKLWNCTDILPRYDADELTGCGIELRSRTYGAAARAINKRIP